MKTCESSEERTGRPCLVRAVWKVQVGTREADAQLACGRHVHRVAQAMYGAEEPRHPVITLTALWEVSLP
jgi:hypothetical protein